MSGDGNFYALLHQLVVSDDDVIRYRAQMDGMRTRIEEKRAKCEAECNFILQQIEIVGRRETDQVDRLTRRFLALRRKELGLKPIKKDKLIAR